MAIEEFIPSETSEKSEFTLEEVRLLYTLLPEQYGRPHRWRSERYCADMGHCCEHGKRYIGEIDNVVSVVITVRDDIAPFPC